MENNKKRYLIIGMFAIILTFFGGSLAYWQWETSTEEQTAVNFTITEQFSCSVDGGGDVSSTDKMLVPASCTNSEYAIQRTITATADVKDANATVSMDLWLDINSIDTELSQSANFKYALTTDPNSCTEGVIGSGSFTGKSANSTAAILNDKIYTATGTDTYYLYIWLDAEETNPNTMDKNFSLSLNGSCETIDYVVPPNEPVLDDGMIPITLSSTGVATVADTSSEWYNYEEKEWANAVLVNKDATADVEGSQSREYYLNNPGTTIVDSDILAYYVWIPRYKYQIWTTDASTTTSPQTINIVFEDSNTTKSNGTSVGQYLTHPAFTFGDQELDGIWAGKFETSGSASTPTIKPNVSSLRSQNVSTQFTTSLVFAGGTLTDGVVSFAGNDTYGLTTNADSHMMKNSEWGAVAYLSHSQYGINQEIYINNSEEYYTGRSGGNVGGSVNTLATQFPDSQTSTSQYNSYGYYTWTGQAIGSDGTIGEITDSTLGTKASTTGNITGVYDMSGGAEEYVMGVLSDANGNPRSGNSSGSNSGFNGIIYDSGNNTEYTSGIAFPENKYYDLYSSEIFTGDFETNMGLCTLDSCGGDALFETANWYSDYAYFVDSDGPWFNRGCAFAFDASAGAFGSYGLAGDAFDYDSWRSSLLVAK